MNKNCLLINPNRMLPPIGPVGIEYVAAAMEKHGYEPVLCDLTFEPDWKRALQEAINASSPSAIGFSIRNIDDAFFASQDFVIETTREMIQYAMELTDAPVIVGGVGFSAAPREILEYTGAQYGIAGEGEEALSRLLDCLLNGGEVNSIPGVVYHENDGKIIVNPPRSCDLTRGAVSRRNFADNERYFREGGQAGIETLRGCPHCCIYCVDPLAKGHQVRVKHAEHVVAEFRSLLEQGIDTVHLCDCEFNLAPDHVQGWCEALTNEGIAEHIRWYAYASVLPFNEDLAAAVKRAGCVGINFGVDHGDPEMLRRLGRKYDVEDIKRAAWACKNNGIAVMFDTLLGGPGETRESIAATIDLMRECSPDRVGLSCGVRVYPGTELARHVRQQGAIELNPNLHGQKTANENFLRPIFYVDAAVSNIHAFVTSLVRGDERFLHADPAKIKGNYNYNNNSGLARAIQAGARGAYWDILRKQCRVNNGSSG